MKVFLEQGAVMPTRAHATDAGIDLYSREDKVIEAGGSAVFHTGVHVELPKGTCGVIVSKSGLNVKHDITSTGLIDEGYEGEIVVKLYNHGKASYQVEKGDKISQLVVFPVSYEMPQPVDHLDETSERGSEGFGSTGRK